MLELSKKFYNEPYSLLLFIYKSHMGQFTILISKCQRLLIMKNAEQKCASCVFRKNLVFGQLVQ